MFPGNVMSSNCYLCLLAVFFFFLVVVVVVFVLVVCLFLFLFCFSFECAEKRQTSGQVQFYEPVLSCKGLPLRLQLVECITIHSEFVVTHILLVSSLKQKSM